MRNSLLTCLVRATLARKRFHALEIWHNVYPGVGRVREYSTACYTLQYVCTTLQYISTTTFLFSHSYVDRCVLYCKTLSKRINSEDARVKSKVHSPDSRLACTACTALTLYCCKAFEVTGVRYIES